MLLDTALALLFTIPAIIALVQEGKDKSTKSLTGLAIILGALIAVDSLVHLRDQMSQLHAVFQIIRIGLGVLGIVLVVRLNNHVAGTCCAVAGGLIALIAIGLIE